MPAQQLRSGAQARVASTYQHVVNHHAPGLRRSEVIKQAVLLFSGSLTGLASPSPSLATPTSGSVARLETLRDCSLAVSIYPTFAYNATGGGGRGRVLEVNGDVLTVEFDATSLNIPPIDYRSTKVVGVPIPPPLKIEILPKSLKGTIDVRTGRPTWISMPSFSLTPGRCTTRRRCRL